MLATDYQGKLDETADKYIHYITDGTTRMQALITDLLTYSRIGRIELNKQPTNLNVILSQVKTDLSVAIEENNAIITAIPGLNGQEVLQKIKGDEQLKHIPVLILTTSKSQEEILSSYKLGANAYMTKTAFIRSK